MPNWVYNSLKVRGDAKAIAEFKLKAQRTEASEEGTVTSDFSFWNFKTPPAEALNSGEYHATHGFSKEHGETGQSKNNWYNWNNREWGTKWDACEVEVAEEADTFIHFTFNTAWSPPTPVFEAIAEQHPEIQMEAYCIEEQGWGVEYESADGVLYTTDEWDIPSTHEESMRRTESCQCEWVDITDFEERESLFADCPNKMVTTETALSLLEKAEIKISR
jgi:hypothetical protein